MTTSNSSTGENVLFRDSKLGNLVNSVAVAGLTALIGAVAEWDWSSYPTWVATLGAPAAGLAVGWLTSYKAKRFPGRSAQR